MESLFKKNRNTKANRRRRIIFDAIKLLILIGLYFFSYERFLIFGLILVLESIGRVPLHLFIFPYLEKLAEDKDKFKKDERLNKPFASKAKLFGKMPYWIKLPFLLTLVLLYIEPIWALYFDIAYLATGLFVMVLMYRFMEKVRGAAPAAN